VSISAVNDYRGAEFINKAAYLTQIGSYDLIIDQLSSAADILLAVYTELLGQFSPISSVN
jgi:hypothetical protein